MWYLKFVILLLLALMITYMVGPRPVLGELDESIPALELGLDELDHFIAEKESGIEGLKPDNQARIIWADSVRNKTPYSIVYLHGFSASPIEGYPVHTEIAKRFGTNLYLARLSGHGIGSQESFVDLTPQKLLNSAKEALAIGRMIGDSVILMSCSTGGTLSLILAAHHPDIHSLVLYSPNIDFAKPGSNMLTKPWGLQLARLMFRGKHRSLEDWPDMAPYWTMKYRLEGLISLKLMVDGTMTDKTFALIDQPVFLGYYYKNENEQDGVVSVAEMLRMYDLLGTPSGQKRRRAFADAESHVVNSAILSKDVEGVVEETAEFFSEVLQMQLSGDSDL